MLKSRYAVATALALLALTGCSSDDSDKLPYPVLEEDADPQIDVSRGDYQCYTMTTTLGDIVLALDTKYAPATTENFDTYVMAGFYDGLIFHRVIEGFMIQGGGFEPGMLGRQPLSAIDSESKNGLRNYRSRIAMARTSQPHSATSQFFINTVDNWFLDQDKAQDGWGYTVFGGVIEGMDVVDAIANVETGSVSGYTDVPLEDVIITSVVQSQCNQ